MFWGMTDVGGGCGSRGLKCGSHGLKSHSGLSPDGQSCLHLPSYPINHHWGSCSPAKGVLERMM